MAQQHAYTNASDTIRFKIFSRKDEGADAGWDADIFFRRSDDIPDVTYANDAKTAFRINPQTKVWSTTFTHEVGDVFRTKNDALKWVKENYGKLKRMPPDWQSMFDGWDH